MGRRPRTTTSTPKHVLDRGSAGRERTGAEVDLDDDMSVDWSPVERE